MSEKEGSGEKAEENREWGEGEWCLLHLLGSFYCYLLWPS